MDTKTRVALWKSLELLNFYFFVENRHKSLFVQTLTA